MNLFRNIHWHLQSTLEQYYEGEKRDFGSVEEDEVGGPREGFEQTCDVLES